MPTFELRPFDLAEAETVAHWVTSPADLWLLNGSDEFPLTAAQVMRWLYETNYAFTLRRDGDIVAYGEILEDEVEDDVELQHVIVAPDMRGQGVGKVLLSRLCAFLEAAKTYPEVWLRVGRDNEPAAQCAHAVGFEEDSTQSGPRYLWLKKSLTLESKP